MPHSSANPQARASGPAYRYPTQADRNAGPCAWVMQRARPKAIATSTQRQRPKARLLIEGAYKQLRRLRVWQLRQVVPALQRLPTFNYDNDATAIRLELP